MAIIPQLFKDAVASIGVRNESGIVSWIGTGFFVNKPIGNSKSLIYLVTNKHVVENRESAVIRLREKTTGQLREIDMPLVDPDVDIYKVHNNPKIDIAVIPINGGFISSNNLEFASFDLDNHAVSSDEFLQDGGDEGAFVYMLGYPMGLVDIESTTPICRMGCIARMDKVEIKRNYHFLLDIQNFPGNSGSPILSRPEFVSVGNSKPFGKCALLGIVNAYIPYEEKLVNMQTNRVVETRSENSGLAVVFPVEYIREIINPLTELIVKNNTIV